MQTATYFAIKPVYNRKSKGYDVDYRENADLMLVHEGFLVFDNVQTTIDGIRSGRFVSHWKPKQRESVLWFLMHSV